MNYHRMRFNLISSFVCLGFFFNPFYLLMGFLTRNSEKLRFLLILFIFIPLFVDDISILNLEKFRRRGSKNTLKRQVSWVHGVFEVLHLPYKYGRSRSRASYTQVSIGRKHKITLTFAAPESGV